MRIIDTIKVKNCIYNVIECDNRYYINIYDTNLQKNTLMLELKSDIMAQRYIQTCIIEKLEKELKQ